MVQNLVIPVAVGTIWYVSLAAVVIAKMDTMMLDIVLTHHHLIQSNATVNMSAMGLVLIVKLFATMIAEVRSSMKKLIPVIMTVHPTQVVKMVFAIVMKVSKVINSANKLGIL